MLIISINEKVMINKKLISIRLDADILEKVDELSKKHHYWKRSTIINLLLSVLLKCSDSGVLWRMLSVFSSYEKGYVIRFEVDKDTISERNKPTYDD